MPRCPDVKCGAALIYEPEFVDIPGKVEMPSVRMDGV